MSPVTSHSSQLLDTPARHLAPVGNASDGEAFAGKGTARVGGIDREGQDEQGNTH